MVWVVLWCVVGFVVGVFIVKDSYERTGELSLGDVFRICIGGPLAGVLALVFILLSKLDDIT